MRLPAVQNISRSVRYTEAGIATLRTGRFGLRALVGPKVLSFQRRSTLAPAPIQTPVQWAPRLFPGGEAAGCGLATYPHLCVHGMLQGDIFLYVVHKSFV